MNLRRDWDPKGRDENPGSGRVSPQGDRDDGHPCIPQHGGYRKVCGAHYRDEPRGEDAGWKPQGSLFHYKELEKVGLAAPQVTYVMHDLKERGFDVSPDATTIEEAADEIMKSFQMTRSSN